MAFSLANLTTGQKVIGATAIGGAGLLLLLNKGGGGGGGGVDGLAVVDVRRPTDDMNSLATSPGSSTSTVNVGERGKYNVYYDDVFNYGDRSGNTDRSSGKVINPRPVNPPQVKRNPPQSNRLPTQELIAQREWALKRNKNRVALANRDGVTDIEAMLKGRWQAQSRRINPVLKKLKNSVKKEPGQQPKPPVKSMQ